MKFDPVEQTVSGPRDCIDTAANFDEIRIIAAFARFRLRRVLMEAIEEEANAPLVMLTQEDINQFSGSDENKALTDFMTPKSGVSKIADCLQRVIKCDALGNYFYQFKYKAQDDSDTEDVHHVFARSMESPLNFCQTAPSENIRQNDIQYFYYRSVCEYYGLTYGDSVAAAFYRLGNRLNAFFHGNFTEKEAPIKYNSGVKLSDLLTFLCLDAKPKIVKAFLECCFSTHLFQIFYSEGTKRTYIRQRGVADSEYLFSVLFAVPTACTGLNQLFGGGGLLMTIGTPQLLSSVPGRVLLASGRFGSGKTVLALLLASEVARKGGVAWYFSTEQTVAEVLYTLRTITSEPSNKVRIITDTKKAIHYVENERGPHEGVLIVLCLSDVNEDQLWGGLTLSSLLGKQQLNSSSLRIAVIDSLNAIPIIPKKAKGKESKTKENSLNTDSNFEQKSNLESERGIRRSLYNGLKKCTRDGMNLLLLEEHSGTPNAGDYSNFRNLADCVIELTIDSPDKLSSHGYARRNIEILKSRFQRDQRGRHIFSISPPYGLRVVPSVPAFKARVGSRRLETGRRAGMFGIKELDRILQVQKLSAGEVNVVRGDPGTFKTSISAAFLNEVTKEVEAQHRPSEFPLTGLFVSMRMGTQDFTKTLATVANSNCDALPDHIRVCQLPNAFITPGEILSLIEQQLRKANDDGMPIRRVVLDNIGTWSIFSPFIRDDTSFGPILLDFFARQTLLLMATVNSFVQQEGHHLHDFIVENATRLIHLEQLVHGGRQRALIRAIDTPSMNHMRDAFEVGLDDNGKLLIDTRPSLFEVTENNQHSARGIQLYLQCESKQQMGYNERIEHLLQATLTPDVHTRVPENISGAGNFTALGLSVINKLQIMQIDGFRLRKPLADAAFPRLYNLNSFGTFDDASSLEISPYLERMQNRTRDHKGRVIAVPYYDNLSFLVGNHEKLQSVEMNMEEITWEQIAEKSLSERSKNQNITTLNHPFFDFPQFTDENINCLFLEVLFSVIRNTDKLFYGIFDNFSQLRDSLLGKPGRSAVALFYQIASPSFLFHSRVNHSEGGISNTSVSGPDRFYVSSEATVWRHWFTTYNQMMAYGGIGDKGISKPVSHLENCTIKLGALPGGWTTAGEWYLCVPEHSAVPGAGLSVINLLQNESADRERYDLGVGLPVRTAAYEIENDDSNYPKCPSSHYLTLDFFKNLQSDPQICREKIPGYCALSPFLANWLRRLLCTTNYTQQSVSEDTLFKVLRGVLKRTKAVVEKARIRSEYRTE